MYPTTVNDEKITKINNIARTDFKDVDVGAEAFVSGVSLPFVGVTDNLDEDL